MDKRVVKLLPTKLSKEEWDDRARAVARLSDEIADAERHVDAEKEAAKARVQDANAVLEGLRAKQRSLSRVVREMQEDREVSCSSTLDRAKMIETITRLDCNEVVQTSPITTSEARDGAAWVPNFERDVCELIHPDEPATILDTREIEDEERQLALGADEDEKPAPKPASKKGKRNGAESPL